MPIIHTLNEHLTNMIAAGEVVERPSGVVKELVENAIDAKATQITVKVYNGGCDSIEVIDDGCGMDPSDATHCFDRHATSKISDTADLWEIHTMGFRGEALPSIAAVAKVTLQTNDGNSSTQVKMEYGKLVAAGPYGCPDGTSIKVEGLFYKTPARLKHLKSGNIELNYVLEIMQKFALSHPEIAFELYSDDKVRLATNGSNSLGETVLAVYGYDVAQNAIEVEFADDDFKVNGIIVMPGCNRSTRNYISSFINGRIVRSLFMQRAICEGYSGFMMPDRYPICILNIVTDFKLVDVNVHPSKWEIRLSKEKQLCTLLKDSIKDILQKHLQPADIKLTVKPVKEHIEQTPLFTETVYTDFTKNEYKEKINEPLVAKEEEKRYVPTEKPVIERFTFLAQFHGSYILACDSENLYVVDQHAAQERCMYEDIQKQIEQHNVVTQPLLVPIVLELTAVQLNQLDKINEVANCIGVNVEAFGGNGVIIREVPIWFENLDEEIFLKDLFDDILDDKMTNQLDIRKEKIASLACHSSIKFNHYLSELESRSLLKRLGNCVQPFNCPHGRPTMMAISDKQLLKEFKRV